MLKSRKEVRELTLSESQSRRQGRLLRMNGWEGSRKLRSVEEIQEYSHSELDKKSAKSSIQGLVKRIWDQAVVEEHKFSMEPI